jgi:uncharacterized protein (DUF4213/DUF364 family)
MIQDTFKRLQEKLEFGSEEITIEKIRIGAFLTGLKLSNGEYGMASTQFNLGPRSRRRRDPAAPFAPGHILGHSLATLFEGPSESPFINSIKVAVLNALSAKLLNAEQYHFHEKADPVDLAIPDQPASITIVGAFQSYIRKFRDSEHHLRVLELNPDALQEDDKHFFVPAAESEKTLKSSDVVIITGSTMVNGSMEGLLAQIPEQTKVVVTGPSSSFIPDLLFEKGVDFVGGTQLTDPEKMLEIVSQAGSGYHLFRHCGRKITVSR